MNFCRDGGYLVGGRGTIPDDPTVFCYAGDVVGCSRLVCQDCKQAVRQAPGHRVRSTEAARRAFGAADWSQPVEGLERADDADRLYLCNCWYYAEHHDARRCAVENPEWNEPTFPWRCGGHPLVTLPLTLDGHVFDADTDLGARVRASFVEPTLWASKLYARLGPAHPLAPEVARAVAALLDDDDVRIRVQALLFFSIHAGAPHAERVGEVAARRPELFGEKKHPSVW